MEDGPTRAHTLHTIGSGADTRHTVTGRSIGSGPLDAQLTAHRTAHEVALCSTGAAGGGRKRQGGDADSGATQRQTDTEAHSVAPRRAVETASVAAHVSTRLAEPRVHPAYLPISPHISPYLPISRVASTLQVVSFDHSLHSSHR